jgi:hypothetical protein
MSEFHSLPSSCAFVAQLPHASNNSFSGLPHFKYFTHHISLSGVCWARRDAMIGVRGCQEDGREWKNMEGSGNIWRRQCFDMIAMTPSIVGQRDDSIVYTSSVQV